MKGLAGSAAIACCLAAAACGLAGCGSVEHGEDLFDLHCAACHETSNPELKKQPPKLEGLFREDIAERCASDRRTGAQHHH